MPIIGLTDKPAQLPEIGRFYKGEKKRKIQKGDKEIEVAGQDLKYFRFESQDVDATAAIHSIYKSEPNNIRIILPYLTIEENFETWHEHYTASALQHRCDSKTCVLWLKPDGSYSEEPKPCPGGCKPAGKLKVVVPELGRLAIITVLTHSINDILNIHANLLWLQEGRRSLRGIPLVLRRIKKEISTPETDKNGKRTGKRMRREKWLIQVEAQEQYARALFAAQEQHALIGIRGALPPAPAEVLAGVEEDEEENELIPDNPLQKASDEKIALFESLLNVWVAIGKPAEEWATYRKEKLDNQSVEQLKKTLTAWEKKAMELQDSKVATTNPDDILAAIHREIAALREESLQVDEINAEVLAITHGEDLVECDTETLTKVLAILEVWNQNIAKHKAA